MDSHRRLIIALGACAFAARCGAYAQQQARRHARIGILSPVSPSASSTWLDAFRKGLGESGWVEGRNLTIEYRFAEGRHDRLPELAVDLAQRKVEVILSGSTAGAFAANKATRTIPIVAITTGDLVATGLIASLAKPGGNLTGVTALGRELSAKRLSLLKEAVPGISRVSILTNPDGPEDAAMLTTLEAAALSLGVHLQVVGVRSVNAFEAAFARIGKERAEAIMVLTDILFTANRKIVVDLVSRTRLPTMYAIQEFVHVGGLMFYGAAFVDMYRRAAAYVDRILRGARPADLPVEQPTTFELVINMRTARALGITIPPSVMVQVTGVVE